MIEKEWIAYGHKFAQRHGFDKNMGKEKDEQRAPIFFQFLDCLYQLVQQYDLATASVCLASIDLRRYPTAFEFTQDFIIALADHAHSALFGTFLANNVAERAQMRLPTATVSLWTYALHCSDTQPGFLNPSFQPTTDTLKMSATLADIKLFAPYFMRWSAAGAGAPSFNYLLRTVPK